MPEAGHFKGGLPDEHLHAIVAAAGLVGRSGGKAFNVGYLDETPRMEDARWWASAEYRGAKVIIDEQQSPALACELLARRILEGGRCAHCRQRVTLKQVRSSFGNFNVAGGTRHCRWFRVGPRWFRGCEQLDREIKELLTAQVGDGPTPEQLQRAWDKVEAIMQEEHHAHPHD